MSADELPLKTVLEALCWYDLRNPNAYDPVELGVEQERDPPRDPKCACDLCFYGKDPLAMEILRLRGLLGLPVELPK